jgi:hypothetical protein
MPGDCGNTWSAKDHSTGGKSFICRSSVSPLWCPAALDRLKRDGEAPGNEKQPSVTAEDSHREHEQLLKGGAKNLRFSIPEPCLQTPL